MNSFNNYQRAGFGFIILLTGILTTSACQREPHSEVQRTVIAFGTLIEIVLYDVEPHHANRALDNLEADFNAYHNAWSPWQEGPLSRTNKLIKTAGTFAVPPSVLPLIQQSITLSQSSQGYFNPAIGNLIALWQFHRHDEPDIKPPTDEKIQQLVQLNPKMSDIQLHGIKLKSTNPAVQFNFGAFAKGYAIDQCMQQLHVEGITNAIINAGGDLLVSGHHGERPWRIGIRHPRNETTMAWIEASDGDSIFTSGDYERYYFHNEKRYHHILDPNTGYPASGTASVTVIHDNAGEADAAATALFVAGPERWHDVAKSMAIRYVMLIDTEGTIHMNPAMAKKIHFVADRPTNIVLSEPL